VPRAPAEGTRRSYRCSPGRGQSASLRVRPARMRPRRWERQRRGARARVPTAARRTKADSVTAMADSARVTLTACVETTPSGAAAFLGIGSDGLFYWVKAPNNPQGARSLVPERIVTNIGLAISAPVRPIVLLEIPEGLDFVYAPGHRLRPGIAHGSLDVGQSKVLDDWSGVSGRDNNRTRIAYISALWDLCLGNDPQWLAEFADDAALWSFDHGFWFAGEVDWSAESMAQVGLRPWTAPNVELASRDALNAAAAAVEGLTLADFQAICDDVPGSWGASQIELSAVAASLYARVPGVVERLRAAAESSVFT